MPFLCVRAAPRTTSAEFAPREVGVWTMMQAGKMQQRKEFRKPLCHCITGMVAALVHGLSMERLAIKENALLAFLLDSISKASSTSACHASQAASKQMQAMPKHAHLVCLGSIQLILVKPAVIYAP
mmetsp:Transcript_49952/g.89694  ORF Transcript_49952/g.89694 Transcript_49952/m.89694 type:complete len:126 (+) Transcript_49952:542-919(+)